ncbi:Pyrophosphate-energized vacuolar membrane proton pump [Hordeum vulgare]|nr:Pyrophosphate-energized vacuolar membrane proton pump [Hordeum vulgare]
MGCPPWEGEDKGCQVPYRRENGDAARAIAEKEAICAHILKKQQRRNTCAFAQEHNWAVREMVGLPPKEEKEVNSGEDNSDDKQIRLRMAMGRVRAG